MADNLARPRAFSPSSIRASLNKDQAATQTETAEPEGSFAERTDPLPRPGDDYKASARPSNKPEMTLTFVAKDHAYEGFAYADFERVRLVPGDKPGSGPVLIVRFNGSVVTDVLIEGRQLQPLYNDVRLHRLAWLWEHPRHGDFADEAATVITKITLVPVKR